MLGERLRDKAVLLVLDDVGDSDDGHVSALMDLHKLGRCSAMAGCSCSACRKTGD